MPTVVPYKALENFSKALYGTTGGTYSACIIRPVMEQYQFLCQSDRYTNDCNFQSKVLDNR